MAAPSGNTECITSTFCAGEINVPVAGAADNINPVVALAHIEYANDGGVVDVSIPTLLINISPVEYPLPFADAVYVVSDECMFAAFDTACNTVTFGVAGEPSRCSHDIVITPVPSLTDSLRI